MDKAPIKDRLQETAQNCLESYAKWTEDKKDSKAREALGEAVHELRKVASRLEIELAVNERNETNTKPIPIPPHRDARNRNWKKDKQGSTSDKNSGADNNKTNDGNSDQKTQRRRRAPRKRSSKG